MLSTFSVPQYPMELPTAQDLMIGRWGTLEGLDLHTKLELIPATEGIFDSVLDVLLGLFYRVKNYFKIMSRATKDFKQSELNYYCILHRTRTMRILALDYEAVKTVLIPTPRGMTTGYLAATSAVAECLQAIDIRTRIGSYRADTQQLMQLLGASDIEGLTRQLKADKLPTNTITVDQTFAKVNTIFKNEATGSVKFSLVYSDMGNFRQTVEYLKELEKHLYTVSDTVAQMDLIEEDVSKLIELCKANKERLDYSTIMSMSQKVRAMAVMFETYGLVINDLNRLIHNQVEIFEAIQRALKI